MQSQSVVRWVLDIDPELAENFDKKVKQKSKTLSRSQAIRDLIIADIYSSDLSGRPKNVRKTVRK